MAKLALIWFILEVAGLKPANAAVMPFVHPLFSSHMVRQRDASDPVWGWMTSGETVTAMVKDQNGNTLQTKTAVARAEGRWQANVEPFVLVTPERITFAAPGGSHAQACLITPTTTVKVSVEVSDVKSITIGMEVRVQSSDATHAASIEANNSK